MMRIRKQQTMKFITDPKASFGYVESFNALRTNLEYLASGAGAKCFVITSALPEEGKTSVTLNLAASLSRNGKSVIVVECDMRKPGMDRQMELQGGSGGLSSVLTGAAELEDSICFTSHGNFHVLPAGTIPPNPSELLGMDRMHALLDHLRERFDYILLDAPPVALVTDAAVLGRMVDGALLVVRSNYAHTDAIRNAKNRLEAVSVRIFGVILTQCKMKKRSYRRGDYSDCCHYGAYAGKDL